MTNIKKDYGREVAHSFVESIKNDDSLAFWKLLDRRGQGYFIGMWFYVLGDASVNMIMKFTEEKGFLDNTLGPIINSLKESLGSLLDDFTIGDIIYLDDVHAKIPIISIDGSVSPNEADNIPLILELTSMSETDTVNGSGEINFTCWKIDTLKCIQVRSM